LIYKKAFENSVQTDGALKKRLLHVSCTLRFKWYLLQCTLPLMAICWYRLSARNTRPRETYVRA